MMNSSFGDHATERLVGILKKKTSDSWDIPWYIPFESVP